MKLFRHPGLMIAVFWCAAMVVAPMAAAAGAGQGMNPANNQAGGPGQVQPASHQMQQGPGQGAGSGKIMNQQEYNGRNAAGPGEGTGPQGTGRGNITEFRNMTPLRDRDPANVTAMNRTAWHGQGNMTRVTMSEHNRTVMHPPAGWGPASMTAPQIPPDQPPQQGNQTGQGQPGSHTGQDQQARQNQQPVADRKDAGDDLIAELIAWLKEHGGV